MRKFFLIIGLLLLFVAEILSVYLLMPFPGSQQFDTIGLAYFLFNNMLPIRIIGFLIIAYPAWIVYKRDPRWKKIRLSLFLLTYIVLASFLNLSNTAGKQALTISDLRFSIGADNKIPANETVMCVEVNGRAKAYPLGLLSYHQQLIDTFGLVKVLITYSAESNSGRVYSSYVDMLETFVDLRIIGMNDFNTVMQDDNTRSWWQQESGEAVAGPLTHTKLKRLPSEQMTLASWQRKHPESLVMQPDSAYVKKIGNMGRNAMIKPDTASWQSKSLVVGVTYLETSKAYDWNQLVKEQMIQDSLPLYPVLLLAEKDKTSFHLYNRLVNGIFLRFVPGTNGTIRDVQTNSVWSIDGVCVDGPLKGNVLPQIEGYQEFWRAWKNFHPATKIYK